MSTPTVEVAESGEAPGEPQRAFAHEYFTPVGSPAKTRRNVQRRASVAAVFEQNRLPRIDADTNSERKLGVGLSFLVELRLKIDGSADCLAGRLEHRQCLIAAKLDHAPAPSFDPVVHDIGELSCEASGDFVAVLLGEPRVATHVR